VLTGTNMMNSTHQVEWSSDGTTLVTGGGNKEYNAKIWDVKTGKLLGTFPMIAKMSRMPFDPGYKDLDNISFHPSLPLVTVVNKNYTRLLNPANGELLQTLDNSSYPGKWTTDGRLLITTSKDGKLKIWELIKSDLNMTSSN
jgi:WD40 repeat protein